MPPGGDFYASGDGRNGGLFVIVDIPAARDGVFVEEARREFESKVESESASPPRRVVMVVFPEVQLLDVVGPLEVLAAAGLAETSRGRGPGYAIEIVGPEPGVVRASSGLTIGVDRTFEDRPGSIDEIERLIGEHSATSVPRAVVFERQIRKFVSTESRFQVRIPKRVHWPLNLRIALVDCFVPFDENPGLRRYQ